jgi:alanine-glyoxylate transaminase/serine-glyoxylate transaminase/serine-pyruvate transaminase
LRNAWARHEEAGRALQDGLEKRGFELIAPVTNRLPELTTVWVPSSVDDAFVRRALLERYSIEIGGGVGAMAGKAWRIGCMGHTARLRNVAALLAALDEVVTW